MARLEPLGTSPPGILPFPPHVPPHPHAGTWGRSIALDTPAHTRPPGASGRESKSPQFGGGDQIVDLYMYGADFPD